MNFKQIISLNLVVALFVPSAFGQLQQPSSGIWVNPSWRRDFGTRPTSIGAGGVTTGAGIGATGMSSNFALPMRDTTSYGGSRLGRLPQACFSLDCFKDTSTYGGLGVRNSLLKASVLDLYSDTCAVEGVSTGLDEAQDSTDVAACYKNRNEIESGVVRSEFDKFQEDIAICGCLRAVGDKFSAVKSIMGKSIDELRGVVKGDQSGNVGFGMDPRIKNFDDNAMAVRQQMDRNSFGMTFQASVLAKMADTDGSRSDNLASIYATDPLGREVPAYDIVPPVGARFDARRDGSSRSSNRLADNIESITEAPSSTAPSSEAPTATAPSSVPSGIAAAVGAMGGITTSTSIDLVLTSDAIKENLPGNIKFSRAPGSTQPGQSKSTSESDSVLANRAITDSINRMKTPAQPPEALFDPVDVMRPQCVSAREFMAYKQMPDAAVVREIQNSTDPEEWNYTSLKKEYDSIMRRPYADREGKREKIASLKTKLFYLERNPMLKNFFKAETAGNEQYMRIKQPANPEEITNAYKADPPKQSDIQSRKAQLMDILKKSIGNSSEAAKAHQDFLRFFTHPSNVVVTRTENDKANLKLVDDFLGLKKAMFSEKPKAMSRDEVDRTFASYNLGSPKNCDESASIEMCVTTYAGYCSYLAENSSKITNLRFENDPVLVDDLEDKVKTFFEPDPQKNPELRDFIDSACNTPRRKGPSDTSGNYQTFWQYFDSKCGSKGINCRNPKPEDIQNLRVEYLTDNPESAQPNRGVPSRDLIAFNELMKKVKVGRVSAADREAIANAGIRPWNPSTALADMNRSWGFEDNMFETAPQRPAEVSFATAGTGVGAATTKIDNRIDNSSVIDDPMTPSYSMFNGAAALGNTPVQAGDQPQKVENMTEPQRQELLDDWQKEYDTWKKSRTAESSQAATAAETAMKARIEALEQLLAQQKKLTDDQYKLLNDAIANQTRSTGATSVAQAQSEGSSSQSNVRNRSLASVAASESEEQASRNPASVPEQNFNTSGSGAGAGSASVGSSGGAGSARRAGATSGDDVAREEAKLVSMRSSSDGSIVISNVNPSAGAVANAVSVPVSDEQYRALQANPQSLNLAQIEQSIPRDQIAKLEKEGEIIILLRNGSNPPFEVKVARKNNKLVYSLKDKNGRDQAPIRRVYTRQALELQLKATR